MSGSGAAKMQLYGGVQRAVTPPIADVQSWVADNGLQSANRPLLDVAQAVPVEPPDPRLLAHLQGLLGAEDVHRYTPIRGLPALRTALAEHLGSAFSAPLDAEHVTITAGCNQAYCESLRVLAGPGDQVILPVPYYFNHQMWLDMLGVKGVYVPFEPEHGGVPSIEAIVQRITERTRAIVLVSPNNPTGAVYPPAFLEQAYDAAADAGIALVLDETYMDFHPGPGAPHALFDRVDWEEVLVQLYSFSKAFSLTGYRVGSVVAGPRFSAELAKVQDCVSICAAALSQRAALFALHECADFVAVQAARMGERIEALRAAFAAADTGFELIASGAWFAYVAHPFSGASSTAVAKHMAQRHGILSVPGEMFGPGQSAYLRFAFANLEAAEMPALAERLAEVDAS